APARGRRNPDQGDRRARSSLIIAVVRERGAPQGASLFCGRGRRRGRNKPLQRAAEHRVAVRETTKTYPWVAYPQLAQRLFRRDPTGRVPTMPLREEHQQEQQRRNGGLSRGVSVLMGARPGFRNEGPAFQGRENRIEQL